MDAFLHENVFAVDVWHQRKVMIPVAHRWSGSLVLSTRLMGKNVFLARKLWSKMFV